jgi:hypothetical protein
MNSREISKLKGWTMGETIRREKLAGYTVKRGRGAHDFTDEDITALEAVNSKEGE